MSTVYDRDLIGYGPTPPDPKWPNGARLALNFVINVEEGSEPSVQDGEGYTEVQHTEAFARNQGISGRDLAGEGMPTHPVMMDVGNGGALDSEKYPGRVFGRGAVRGRFLQL